MEFPKYASPTPDAIREAAAKMVFVLVTSEH
jgi:hypothetical protein